MASNDRRDELVLILLAKNNIPLDPESVAATYGTPVENWRAAFDQLEEGGDIEQIEDGLYKLTRAGQEKVQLRGGRPLYPLPDILQVRR